MMCDSDDHDVDIMVGVVMISVISVMNDHDLGIDDHVVR